MSVVPEVGKEEEGSTDESDGMDFAECDTNDDPKGGGDTKEGEDGMDTEEGEDGMNATEGDTDDDPNEGNAAEGHTDDGPNEGNQEVVSFSIVNGSTGAKLPTGSNLYNAFREGKGEIHVVLEHA